MTTGEKALHSVYSVHSPYFISTLYVLCGPVLQLNKEDYRHRSGCIVILWSTQRRCAAQSCSKVFRSRPYTLLTYVAVLGSERAATEPAPEGGRGLTTKVRGGGGGGGACTLICILHLYRALNSLSLSFQSVAVAACRGAVSALHALFHNSIFKTQ
jgi:hypothetical protein